MPTPPPDKIKQNKGLTKEEQEKLNKSKFTYWQQKNHGDTYERQILHTKKYFYDIEFPYIKKYIKKSDTVLDVGAGTGILSLALAQYGCDVTSADISDEMLAALEKNKRNLRIKTVHTNCMKLPFESNEFDAVVSRWFMSYFYQWEDFLKEQARIVKQNGIIMFDTVNGDHLSQGDPSLRMKERQSYIAGNTFYASITQKELEDFCCECGLEIEKIIPYNFISLNSNAQDHLTTDELYNFMDLFSKFIRDPRNRKVIKLFEHEIVQHLPPELCANEYIVLRKKRM